MADRFKVDPIAVLRTGYFDWALRVASLEVVVGLERKAHEKANRGKQ